MFVYIGCIKHSHMYCVGASVVLRAEVRRRPTFALCESDSIYQEKLRQAEDRT